jgi:hypothetical protein
MIGMPTPYRTPSLFSVVILTTVFGFGAAEVDGADELLDGALDVAPGLDAFVPAVEP